MFTHKAQKKFRLFSDHKVRAKQTFHTWVWEIGPKPFLFARVLRAYLSGRKYCALKFRKSRTRAATRPVIRYGVTRLGFLFYLTICKQNHGLLYSMQVNYLDLGLFRRIWSLSSHWNFLPLCNDNKL